MLVSVTYGNENFADCHSKYYIFACRTSQFPLINPPQKHLWVAAKEGLHGLSRHGGLNFQDAAPGFTRELGKWTSTMYDIPEGFVLKIFGRRKLPGVVGWPANAEMFLQVRENAALQRVVGRLTGSQKAQRSHVEVFEGRADILEDRDLNELGIGRQHGRDTGSLFELSSLSPQISGKHTIKETVVKDSEGKETVIKTIERKRAIDI